MAAPQVSGVAVLVAEAFLYFSAHNLQQTLLTTATPLGDTSIAGDGLIGQLHTAGVVAPGTAANTLGVLIITDAFTATNTATLEVSATAEGQSSALLVKGVSAIDGINIALKGDVFRPAVSYTLLSS